MATYFADSSAIIKCYVAEAGSAWVNSLLTPSTNLIILSRLATVEVPAGLARRRREASIVEPVFLTALKAFRNDVLRRYRLIEPDELVCNFAAERATRHSLRAYDAIQLASAIAAHDALVKAGVAALIFLCADARLNAVAQAEGLSVDDPNLHS